MSRSEFNGFGHFLRLLTPVVKLRKQTAEQMNSSLIASDAQGQGDEQINGSSIRRHDRRNLAKNASALIR
jgi:hypothetical protein